MIGIMFCSYIAAYGTDGYGGPHSIQERSDTAIRQLALEAGALESDRQRQGTRFDITTVGKAEALGRRYTFDDAMNLGCMVQKSSAVKHGIYWESLLWREDSNFT